MLFEARLTPRPPVAAGPVNVTVPTDFAPPTTVEGDTETLSRDGGLIVKVAFVDALPRVPVNEAVVRL